MVRFQSISEALGRRLRTARLSAPLTAVQQHLHGAAEEEGLFQPHEFLAGKLHAYGEHEEGDAHVGHGVHRFRRGNEPEGGGAAQHAGKQKAHDGGQAEAQADKNDDDGKHEENDDFAKNEVFHGQS